MWCSAGWESVRRKRFICHIYYPLPSERKASCRRTRILKMNLFRSHRPVKPDWQRGYSRNQKSCGRVKHDSKLNRGPTAACLLDRYTWCPQAGTVKTAQPFMGPIMLLSFSSNWRAAEIAIITYKTKEWEKNGWNEQHSERCWDGSGEFDEWISPSYW